MPKFMDGSSTQPFTSSVKAMIPEGSVMVTYLSLSPGEMAIVAIGVESIVGDGVLNFSVLSTHEPPTISTMCTSMVPGTSTSDTNRRRLASAMVSGSDPSVDTSNRRKPNSMWPDLRSTSTFRSAPKIVVGFRDTT